MTAAAPPSQRWLYGPFADLLLGCGLGYAAIFVLQAVAGPQMRGVLPYGLAPLVLLLSGTPHYGATLLRVYERREDRRAYAIFAVWITLLLAALFVAAVYQPLLGSWLLTLMLTWSPWHYTGQNYGVALMFLRRRGVPISNGTKRWIYASFLLSFVLTLLAVHGPSAPARYAPFPYSSTEYHFISLGIPDAVRGPGMLWAAGAYLLALAVSATRLLRVGTLRDLAPAAVIAGTQALWFVVPVLARRSGALEGIEPLASAHATYAFLWVAVGHSLQYLWVSSYYARRQDRETRQGPYLAKSVCAGAALWVVPALLFAPGLLGRAPFDAGLEVLIAAVVNLHHFVLDGAIWKLRDGRVARILIRSDEHVSGPAPPVEPPRWRLAPATWALGALCAGVIVAATLETEFGLRRALAQDDLSRAERAIGRLVWLGRDSPSARALLGVRRAEHGDWEQAIRDVEASLALHPTPQSWHALGAVYVRAGRPEQAIAPYREALRMRPAWPEVENNLAWIRATHPERWVRDPDEAVRLAESAARGTDFAQADVLDTLAAAYASAHRFAPAQRVAERARALALEAGDGALARQIEQRAALYAAGKPYRESSAAGRTLSSARPPSATDAWDESDPGAY